MAETRSDTEAKRKVWDMIRKVEVAMMVTADEEGRFRGRPMRAVNPESEDVLWFFTEAASPKSDEVRGDERVLLAYADPRAQDYVSVYGTAELVRDREMQKRLWVMMEGQMQGVPGIKETRAAMSMMPDLTQAQNVIKAMQGVVGAGGNAFESMQKVMGDLSRFMPGMRR